VESNKSLKSTETPIHRTALITGVSGQDGTYLARVLTQRGRKVYGVTRQETKNANWFTIDYRDASALQKLLESLRPDEIYHLASPSCLADTWEFENAVFQTGVTVTHQFLRWIYEEAPSTRFYFASSGEVFGCPHQSPQDEETPLTPRHPYAFAKSTGSQLVDYFRKEKGLFACSGILFNHESPLRRTEFVTRRITSGAAAISAGQQKELCLGNLDAVRDWSHAEDFAVAACLIMEADTPDNYILASGEGHTVREFCRIAFATLGLDFDAYVVSDPQRMRRECGEPRIGNPQRAEQRLGWKRQYTFEETIKEMVAADLRRLQP